MVLAGYMMIYLYPVSLTSYILITIFVVCSFNLNLSYTLLLCGICLRSWYDASVVVLILPFKFDLSTI
jgi:hypothetical protein